MKRKFAAGLTAGIMFLLGLTTLAGASAIGFDSVTQNYTNNNWSLGFEFIANEDILVTSLGMYDDYKNGLTENHDVGIFDADGTLLVSTTVGADSYLDGWFRYEDVARTALTAGETYFVVGVTGSENYTYRPNGFTVAPEITFVKDAFIKSPTLAFPTGSSSLEGWFGANFNYTTSAVPEPATLLLMGIGLLGMAGYNLKRRRPE